MYDDRIHVEPPLYVASTVILCWRCGADMPAIALIAPNVPETEGEICVLSNIRELPPPVLKWIRQRFPTFRLKFSRTTQSKYYANTCPKCGVLSGDFFLHAEPGAPFFPTTKEEARHLSIETIPVNESVTVRAGLGIGVGDLILQHARRKSAGQLR
jgi:hypothetical protein